MQNQIAYVGGVGIGTYVMNHGRVRWGEVWSDAVRRGKAGFGWVGLGWVGLGRGFTIRG